MEFFENKIFLLALTFVVYVLAQMLHRRTGLSLLNPILVTMAVIIGFLVAADIPYETYSEGGEYIEFWLKPAVVALGVPLYKQLSTIKKQLIPIIFAEIAGCVVGIISVVLVAQLMGAGKEIILSLAAKSVTTPIAIEITSVVGGIPSLTAAVVVCVGIFGGLTGFKVMKMTRVHNPVAQGLSMGTAAHAIGTSAAMDRSDRHGAFASLGLTVNGFFTAMLTPAILEMMGYL